MTGFSDGATAAPEFRDSQTGDEAKASLLISRIPPSMYATFTAGQQNLELLRADSDEEAAEIVKRRVRTGKIPAVYLYKMIQAEVYEPSSRTLTPQDVQNGLVNKEHQS